MIEPELQLPLPPPEPRQPAAEPPQLTGSRSILQTRQARQASLNSRAPVSSGVSGTVGGAAQIQPTSGTRDMLSEKIAFALAQQGASSESPLAARAAPAEGANGGDSKKMASGGRPLVAASSKPAVRFSTSDGPARPTRVNATGFRLKSTVQPSSSPVRSSAPAAAPSDARPSQAFRR